MKVKSLMWIIMATIFSVCAFMPDNAMAQKKYKWNWDGEKSGNETVDEYLLACDTLWNEIQSYQNDINLFEFKEQIVEINGKTYQVVHLEDNQGNIFTKATANWQLFQSVMSGVSIVLSSVQIGLQTASATLALPQLGLKAFSFGKYVKAGPKIISLGAKEIKGIVQQRKYQWGLWQQVKAGAVDPETFDWEALGLSASMPVDKLKKCFFIKEVTSESENYEEIITIQQNKTEEQKKADLENLLADASKEELPEDANKKLEKEPSAEEMDDLLGKFNEV